MILRLFASPKQQVERSTANVTLPDGREVEVAFVRHPRSRRIKLSVDERGPRLSLPMRASERSALAFLQQHRAWLQAQLEALEEDAAESFIVGESASLPLRGETVPLAWANTRATRIVVHGDALHFEVRSLQPGSAATPAIQRALRDFYEAQARTDVARWLPKYAEGLTKPPSRLAFKRMTTQWGSLSPAGVVALDLSLVLARPSAFEYVLVHELCHLLHHDHSPRFWREVEARFPHWREERDYLRVEGRRIKQQLRTLTG